MESNKSHFTVLLVPSDNKRVREFKLTYTFAALVPILIAVFIIGLIYMFAKDSEKLSSLEAEYKIVKNDAETAHAENILIAAELEEMQEILSQAQTTLDEKNTAEAAASETNTKRYIPDAFPVAGSVGVPTLYAEETPYIQFTVGEKTRIIATADGRVTKVSETVEGLNEIVVDHGNGYISTYTCKGIPIVGQSDQVIRGNTLILSDSGEENPTENLVLTYQLEFNGVSIDPMTMIEVNG